MNPTQKQVDEAVEFIKELSKRTPPHIIEETKKEMDRVFESIMKEIQNGNEQKRKHRL